MFLTVAFNAFDHSTVADIQKKLVKWVKRNPVSRRFHAKKDKETIAAWRMDLDKALQVFNVRSVTWVMTVADFSFSEDTYDKHGCTHFCRSP